MKLKNNAPGGRGFGGFEIEGGKVGEIPDAVVKKHEDDPVVKGWFEDGTFTVPAAIKKPAMPVVDGGDPADPKKKIAQASQPAP